MGFIRDPVEIRVDRWGVPHIAAQSREQAFFGQGFNAARDRLWQIDLWRKRGLGLLAADFGPGYLAQDRAARAFLYRGDIAAEWQAYAAHDIRPSVEAFVAGINAYVDLVERGAAPVPPEFEVLGTSPSAWQAEDVVRIRTHTLIGHAPSKCLRAALVARGALKADQLRRSLVEDVPADLGEPIIEGIDPAMLNLRALASAPVTFSKERLEASLDQAEHWACPEAIAELSQSAAAPREGSNNWAVAAERTQSGRAILANDPHRVLTYPSLRYFAHLKAPGLDIIGAGEPHAPGISLGHNDALAFGLAILPSDQEEVYVYQGADDALRSYFYEGAAEEVRSVTEFIPVKGEDDQRCVMHFTRHGPVVAQDRTRGRLYALRTMWLEPGGAAYFASLGYQSATSFDQFRAALSYWSMPAVRHAVADCEGRVALIDAGRVPDRNWSGLLPVAGDGRFEWAGFHSMHVVEVRDPASGFVHSANEFKAHERWHAGDGIGHEFASRYRSDRIARVLEGNSAADLEDMARLQTDTYSGFAQALSKLAREAFSDCGSPAPLPPEDWEPTIADQCSFGTLVEIWWTHHLRPALMLHLIDDPTARELAAPGDPAALLAWLQEPQATASSGGKERHAILRETYTSALEDCRHRFGPDMAGWRWLRFHHAFFEHGLRDVTGDSGWDVGPVGVAGSAQTIMYAAYRNDGRVTEGAAVRMLIDVGEWDLSKFVNAPGQSGDPRSSEIREHCHVWANGGYLPLLYSEAAIARATRLHMTLVPDPGGPDEDSAQGEVVLRPNFLVSEKVKP